MLLLDLVDETREVEFEALSMEEKVEYVESLKGKMRIWDRYLQMFIDSLVGRRIPLQFFIGEDSFTDFNFIQVSLRPEWFGMKDEALYSLTKFLAAHESQHNLSTVCSDFVDAQEAIVDWARDEMAGLPFCKEKAQEIAHGICNSVEDGRIERILISNNRGLRKLQLFMRGMDWNEYSCISQKDAPKYVLLLNNLLSIATTGLYAKDFDAVADKDMMETSKKMEYFIEEGCSAFSSAGLKSPCLNLFKLLFPYIRDILQEEMSEEEKEQAKERERKDSENFSNDKKSEMKNTKGSSTKAPLKEVEEREKKKLKEKDEETESKGTSGKSEEEDKEGEKQSKSSSGKGEESEKSDDEGKEGAKGYQDASGEGDEEGADDTSGKSESGSEENSEEDSEENSKSKTHSSDCDCENEASGETRSASKDDEDHIENSGEEGSFERSLKEALQKAIRGEMERTSKEVLSEGRTVITRALEESKPTAGFECKEDKEAVRNDGMSVREGYKAKSGLSPKFRLEPNDGYRHVMYSDSEISLKGSTLRRNLEKILKSKARPDMREQTSGALDLKSLTKLTYGNPTVFKKLGQKTEFECAGYVLLDGSGSMHGNKNRAACHALGVIEESFGKLFPLKLTCFDEGWGNEVIHCTIKDWDEHPTKNLAWSFYQNGGGGRGNNFDGFSIRVVINLLLRRPDLCKVLIVLSYRCPTIYWVCGSA